MTTRSFVTVLLLGTVLLGGMTACSQPNSSATLQSDSSQPSATQTSDRAQKREAMRKQIEAVLTPDQRQQLQTKLQQGQKMREAMSSLNLTNDQKAKIQEIFKNARTHRQAQSPTNAQ